MEITVNIELTKAEFDLFELIGGDTPDNRNAFLTTMLHKALERRVKWVATFKSRVNKSGPIPANHTTPCWEWTGGKIPSGYGIAHDPITNKITLAHRLMYELSRGPIPEGMIIMHSCDNRVCVNPDHHSIGTHKENTADMYAKGRQFKGIRSKETSKRVIINPNYSRGESHGKAILNLASVAEIHRLRAEGLTQRAIAAKIGVSHGAVVRVLNGTAWADHKADNVSAGR